MPLNCDISWWFLLIMNMGATRAKQAPEEIRAMAEPNTQSQERLAAGKQEADTASIKSRKELKDLFKNGCLPDQSSFGHLIDSFVHQNDLWERASGNISGSSPVTGANHRISALNRAWYVYVDSQNNLVLAESDAARLRINANDRVEIGAPDAPFALQVNGWTGIGMRIGTYSPAEDTRQEYPSSSLVRLQVPADGRWHPIINGLGKCHAFEVVASASGAATTKFHAITHAVAVTSVSGGRHSIRPVYSYDGWYWRRKISFKWQANGGGWFKKGADYSLCVRTGCNFGKGDDGKPAMIRYHITRMW
jgi:hypothetical protein